MCERVRECMRVWDESVGEGAWESVGEGVWESWAWRQGEPARSLRPAQPPHPLVRGPLGRASDGRGVGSPRVSAGFA